MIGIESQMILIMRDTRGFNIYYGSDMPVPVPLRLKTLFRMNS